MKTFIFRRENNKFDDILLDKTIKSSIVEKYQFNQHLILRIKDEPVGAWSYITLMFSEEIVNMNDLVPDRTPKPNIDYVPKRK